MPGTAKRPEFAETVMPHLGIVYRMAQRLTGDRHEAEDLAQETFLRAQDSFDRFELREFGPRPWLLRILNNIHCSRLERRRREPALVDDLGFVRQRRPENESGFQSADSTSDVDWELFDDEIKEAVQALAPEHRAVLLLWSLAGLKYREIAHVLDCAVGTVMSRLHRSRRELNERLRDYARRRGIRAELAAA